MRNSGMNDVRDIAHQAEQVKYYPKRASDSFCHNINAMSSIGQFYHSPYYDQEVNRYVHLAGHTSADDSRIPIKKEDDILHGRSTGPYSSSVSVSSSSSSSALSTSSATFSSCTSRTSDRSVPPHGSPGPEPHWSTGSTGGFILPPSNNTGMEYSSGRPDPVQKCITTGHVSRNEHAPSEIKASVLRSHDVKIKLSSTKCLQPDDALYDAACPLGTSPIELKLNDSHLQPVPSSVLQAGHKVVSAKQLLAYTLFRKKIEVKLPSPSLDLYASLPDTNIDAASEIKGRAISLQFFENREFANSSSFSVRRHENDNNNDNSSSSNSIRSSSLQTINIEAVAVLSKCRRYDGEALEDCGPVVNLSLEIACEPLTQYLQTRHLQQQATITREDIDTWFKHLFDHIATLSDNLNTCVM